MKSYEVSFQARDETPGDVEIDKWYYYDSDMVLVGPFTTESMAERARIRQLRDCPNGACEE